MVKKHGWYPYKSFRWLYYRGKCLQSGSQSYQNVLWVIQKISTFSLTVLTSLNEASLALHLHYAKCTITSTSTRFSVIHIYYTYIYLQNLRFSKIIQPSSFVINKKKILNSIIENPQFFLFFLIKRKINL